MSLFSFLGGAPKSQSETEALLAEVSALRAKSMFFADGQANELATLVMEELAETEDVSLGMRIGVPVARLIQRLLSEEPFSFVPQARAVGGTLSQQVALRDQLRASKRMLENEEYFVTKWSSVIQSILGGMYKEFPQQAFVDPDASGDFDEMSALAPETPLYTFIADVPALLQKIIGTPFSFGIPDDGLFEPLREQLHIRLCIASGIHPEDRHSTSKHLVLPEEKKGSSDAELLELYLADTPFYELLTLPIPLHIPEAVRFEHTHILAGTGHGKTQALQYLIAADLEKAINEERSVVVMDSQGDLLETLMRSEYFKNERLSERFIYIDPTDIERPVGLNLFDVGLDRLGPVSALERETIINGTIELYEYFFGGLLGAELTQKQGVIFRYLAMLMTRIPNANIHTLRELMEDGERFRPYMQGLTGSARAFFETRFFDRSFGETKKQILNRLWGVLSSASLDRMMSAKRNSVDLFQSLQNGSIVFINTAKEFLGHEGSTIFSRMFVALLGQALMRRAAVARHDRTPTYVYIDEAEDVVDLTLTRMLAQVRKYKGAITFAHQNLDQLLPEIRAGVIANTSIKLAGGVSAKDARALADDFRCDTDFLLAQRKGPHETHFACFAKNITDRGVTLSIPLGFLEAKGRASDRSYAELKERSRERYGVEQEPEATFEVVAVPPPRPRNESIIPSVAVRSSSATTASLEQPAAPQQALPFDALPQSTHLNEIVITRVPPRAESKAPRDMGHGGAKHKYLEHLVKELGEARGFLVTLEQPIHDGAGRIDAVLVRKEVTIAVEISVTTTSDHELGNIEKCLALPYTHIVMLTSHRRRQVSLQKFIAGALDEGDKKRVSFLLPEDVPGFLDGYPVARQTTERTVKGYTVRSKVKDSDPIEALARRNAVAKVVAKAMN
ncbi:type IV secretory system conjugative DNA transfer family protein [Roseateles toxinivorans]|uniref:Uncharacterized protein n=1 Tax=Roseateles toxinivorans TaxID=270368 RepID=A0A4R6QE78_9BURK|nr:type IV secretory system conjugative DNA transfer family protein [Roseateles toxinivorans]TDP60640.1 hypothetical protein DES47_11562 [Roseateles toxinivorans]